MPKNNLAQYSTLFYQLIFGGIFLAIILWASKTMMFGSKTNVMMVGGMMAGIAIILLMDDYYWLLLPILQATDINIPGLPFNGFEVGQIAVIIMYFVRKSVVRTKENSVSLNSDLLIVMPMILWIFGMYCYKPCGMNILESKMLGGRWYMQILLAFLSLQVMSTWRLDEKQCKTLYWAMIGTTALELTRNFVRSPDLLFFGSREFSHTSGSLYDFIGFITFFILFFSRHRLYVLVTDMKKLAMVFATGALVAYSGKRMMFGWVVMTPVFRLFLTGRDKGLSVFCAIVGIFIASMIIAGDLVGMYDLPKSARRAFATVSPKMKDKYGLEGQGDRFREIVHAEAERQIRMNPWFGLKGLAIDSTALRLANMFAGGRYDVGHGEARNWHGAFHAYAADFGIPCLLFFLFFIVVSSVKIIKFCRRNVNITSEFQSTMLLYFSLLYCLQLITLKTSGHSSASTQGFFFVYGMFLAVRNGILTERQKANVNAVRSLADI